MSSTEEQLREDLKWKAATLLLAVQRDRDGADEYVNFFLDETMSLLSQHTQRARVEAKVDWCHAAYHKLVNAKLEPKDWLNGQIDAWEYELAQLSPTKTEEK